MTEREGAIAREIVRLAQEDLKLEGEPPAPGETLASRLDSLALLALVVAVEDRFHVVLGDDDAAATRTLEDLARLVLARAPAERLPPEAGASVRPERSGAGGAAESKGAESKGDPPGAAP